MKYPTPEHPAIIYDGAYGTPPGPDIRRMKNVTPNATREEPEPERVPACGYRACAWGLRDEAHVHAANGDVTVGAPAARGFGRTTTRLKSAGAFRQSGPWGRRTR